MVFWVRFGPIKISSANHGLLGKRTKLSGVLPYKCPAEKKKVSTSAMNSVCSIFTVSPVYLPSALNPRKAMGKNKSNPSDEDSGFESNIKSLETIIEKLENNDTALQDALHDFEQGINLVRNTQKALAEAEQKVSLLLDDGDGPTGKAFHLDEEKE